MANQPDSNNLYVIANGSSSSSPFIEIFMNRDPTTNDTLYPIQKRWFNTLTNNEWILVGFSAASGVIYANWQNTGSSSGIKTINTIFPDGSGNFTLTPGANITLTLQTNGLIISSTGGSSTIWTDEALNFLAVVGNGYFATAALTATLPSSPTQGQEVAIAVDTSGTVIIQAATGQTIRLAAFTSSSGGTATSTSIGDSLELIFRAANSEWFSVATEGSWILA